MFEFTLHLTFGVQTISFYVLHIHIEVYMRHDVGFPASRHITLATQAGTRLGDREEVRAMLRELSTLSTVA